MKDVKLTDEEIIKALELMATSESGTSGLTVNVAPYALELVRRQKAEIERLTEEIERQKDAKFRAVLDKYELRKINAELQKQVSELLNRRIEPKIFQCHADTLETCPKVEQAIKDTAKEIFEKIFETLCCFTTQGKSKEYNKGYVDCLAEVDKRIQKVAKEKKAWR